MTSASLACMSCPMKGILLYRIYRALTYGLSPLLHLHLRWRKLRGLEHPHRWPERLGCSSLPRPPTPLLWFHAVSLGEGMAAIPVIKHCNQLRPDLTVLMTTTTLSASEVIRNRLPAGVIHQFAPVDTPKAIDTFLRHWKPNAIVIMENEIWPNLIMGASNFGIPLALLNARMSVKSFKLWSTPVFLPLISLLLSKFSLIVPLSTMQAIHFQSLQAPPSVINFSGDLKYVVNENDASEGWIESAADLEAHFGHRKVWIASSIHKAILGVHYELIRMHPDMITIIAPRHPQHGREIAQELWNRGQSVSLRSQHKKLNLETSIYVVDTLGELRDFYKITPIAVIGGSFVPGLAGHNISEAAAAGCAILTGQHIGHFSHMVLEMQKLNPLSVLQVSSKLELGEALKELFSNSEVLKARQTAAKQAFHTLSSGIVEKVWNLLNLHVLRRLCLENK
ncbi:probable 3-deoxy-D-manno-octulosonic acid transferase, mitochondrial isoform X2 [Carica papaya]|uniref:probable 3-deoxy-D-manno-octulosonic acid transferase, mitochondrial isoform X2 n=1 Tax=Carica papaya TaxID=3649 RepID=UPI000B8C7C41|nr:probable 3-deoxy-D-manno-octulosonic acid transferase, mitochondrial isoform X2 [Carica papaya]